MAEETICNVTEMPSIVDASLIRPRVGAEPSIIGGGGGGNADFSRLMDFEGTMAEFGESGKF